MNNDLLYFTYINIPNNSWTARSLLYWDTVGAIMPHTYIYNPEKLEHDMRAFLQAGLVKPVIPMHYIEHFQSFEQSFSRMTDQPTFQLEQKRVNFLRGNVSRLHIQKMTEGVFDQLLDLGLASRKQGEWEWVYVEENTARLFMMYLAMMISRAGNFTPATDMVKNIDLSLQQRRTGTYAYMRGKFLDNLMPYPLKADPDLLMKFKDRHHDELRIFRNRLEQIITELSAIRDRRERERLYELKLEEINEQKDYIYHKLTDGNLGDIVFGRLFGIAAAAYGMYSDNKPMQIFGLGQAVWSALQGNKQETLLRQDYSYLALIDKKLKA